MRSQCGQIAWVIAEQRERASAVVPLQCLSFLECAQCPRDIYWSPRGGKNNFFLSVWSSGQMRTAYVIASGRQRTYLCVTRKRKNPKNKTNKTQQNQVSTFMDDMGVGGVENIYIICTNQRQHTHTCLWRLFTCTFFCHEVSQVSDCQDPQNCPSSPHFHRILPLCWGLERVWMTARYLRS